MRVLLHAASAAVGAGVGLAAVAVHRMSLLGLPLGMVLAVATTFVVAWSIRLVGHPSRLPVTYGAGWLVVFVPTVVGRDEGDYAVADDTLGYLLILVAFVLFAVVVGWAATVRDSTSRGDGT